MSGGMLMLVLTAFNCTVSPKWIIVFSALTLTDVGGGELINSFPMLNNHYRQLRLHNMCPDKAQRKRYLK